MAEKNREHKRPMGVPDVEPGTRTASVVFYLDQGGYARWRMVSPDGEVIAESLRRFPSIDAAQNGFRDVTWYVVQDRVEWKVNR